MGEGRLPYSPAAAIKGPRKRSEERSAYSRDVILRLVSAQSSLRDQCALQLLGRMGTIEEAGQLCLYLAAEATRLAIELPVDGARRDPEDPEPLCIFENPAADTQARAEIPLEWFEREEMDKIKELIQKSLRHPEMKR